MGEKDFETPSLDSLYAEIVGNQNKEEPVPLKQFRFKTDVNMNNLNEVKKDTNIEGKQQNTKNEDEDFVDAEETQSLDSLYNEVMGFKTKTEPIPSKNKDMRLRPPGFRSSRSTNEKKDQSEDQEEERDDKEDGEGMEVDEKDKKDKKDTEGSVGEVEVDNMEDLAAMDDDMDKSIMKKLSPL